MIQFQPPFFDHLPRLIQPHFSVDDITKQTCPIVCANRYKICPVLSVIVSLQADGSSVMFVGIWHGQSLLCHFILDLPMIQGNNVGAHGRALPLQSQNHLLYFRRLCNPKILSRNLGGVSSLTIKVTYRTLYSMGKGK